MDSALSFTSIGLDDFNGLLVEYPKVVAPKLADLDKARYESIPAALAGRKAIGSADVAGPETSPALEKSELVTLVEWKLSHGTFRPSLKQLAESNSEGEVSTCTVSGFIHFNPAAPQTVSSSLKSLSGLKGVGPATASLLLSVWDPENAPFFSDELFRWSQYEAKPARGWDRPIMYTPKEYLELFAKVAELRERLGIRAIDAEKVAYVLGKRAAGKSAEETKVAKHTVKKQVQAKRKAADVVDHDLATKKTKAKPATTTAKDTTKKSIRTTRQPAEGTRSSARLNPTAIGD